MKAPQRFFLASFIFGLAWLVLTALNVKRAWRRYGTRPYSYFS